jgi:Ssp1 endopeptidase immunity protein Rap1a
MKMMLMASNLLLLSGASAAADPPGQVPIYVDGNKLHYWCQSEQVGERALCAGYIIGASDAEDLTVRLEETTKLRAMRVCKPANASVEQARDIVVKHLRDDPEGRHKAAPIVVWLALHDAWPCGKP